MEPNENNIKDATSSNTDRAGSILEKETLGEYLRKVRIGNRIDIEKMAKDTRLIPDYITAIEKNEFDKIPGETYRKIFIKSVAKYLELNPDEIYARYKQDTHTETPPSAPTTSAGILRPTEDTKKNEAPHTPSKSTQPLLIMLGIVFIILLIILSKGEKKEPEPPKESFTPAVHHDSLQKPAPDTIQAPAPVAPTAADTQVVNEAPPVTPPPEIQEDSITPVIKRRFSSDKKGSLKVELICLQDSLYANAWRNGRFWNNTMRQGDSKVFASDSAVYFRLTPSINAHLNLLGRELIPEPTKTEPVIRVDSLGMTYHQASIWNKLIKRR